MSSIDVMEGRSELCWHNRSRQYSEISVNTLLYLSAVKNWVPWHQWHLLCLYTNLNDLECYCPWFLPGCQLPVVYHLLSDQLVQTCSVWQMWSWCTCAVLKLHFDLVSQSDRQPTLSLKNKLVLNDLIVILSWAFNAPFISTGCKASQFYFSYSTLGF